MFVVKLEKTPLIMANYYGLGVFKIIRVIFWYFSMFYKALYAEMDNYGEFSVEGVAFVLIFRSN